LGGENVPSDLSGLGEAVVKALKRLEQSMVVMRGIPAVHEAVEASRVGHEFGATAAAAELPPRELQRILQFDERWGPSEWGPIPFLPKEDMLVEKMEGSWGSLYSYRGLNSTGRGNLLISGIQARPLI
jgi:magnesium chelatase subunit H